MAPADLHTLVVGREAMACRFEVAFNAGEVAEATPLAVEALDLVDAIEDSISIYRDHSELARLNATAAAGWQTVSAQLFDLLVEARDLHERTAGGFDLAAGRLVRCWGFLHRQGRTPAEDDLVAARATSGMHLVELDVEGRRVRFTRPGVELNPGGIGKGWALDRMIDHLRAAGVGSVLVHGGRSSVRAAGTHGPGGPERAGWKVGLVHPLRPDRRIATLTLVDQALGTSGSGTQFFVDRGRRIGHILDPRSGRPAEGVLSATVLAPTAAAADALATALFVLGPEGLARLAPPGGPVAAVVMLPGSVAGSVEVRTANLGAGMLEIEPDAAAVLVPEPDGTLGSLTPGPCTPPSHHA
jgi:thiamine biosynthesis lipoprotein